MDKKVLKLAKEQRKRCYFCGKKMILQRSIIQHAPELMGSLATFEHKRVRARGGTRAYKNGVVSCLDCNNKRGIIDFNHFAAIRRDERLWETFEKIRSKFYKKMKKKKKGQFTWKDFQNDFYSYFVTLEEFYVDVDKLP